MKSVALQVRDGVGKGGARSARRNGFLPCVVYGLKKPPVAGLVNEREFERIAGADLYNEAFEVKFDEKAEMVLCRAVQFCPITERPMHIDFMRVEKGAPVVARVPVEFANAEQCPGLRKKGTLNKMLRFVRVGAQSVEFLPKKAVVDLSTVDVGVTLGIDAIVLPDGVWLKDVDKTVAKLIPPRVKDVAK